MSRLNYEDQSIQHQSFIQKVPMFDQSLYVIQLNEHFNVKDKLSKVIDDISQKSMNTNNFHHTLVHQTPPGLQMNNAFDVILSSQELQDFANTKAQDYTIPAEKHLVCTNMWATIIPPHGMLRPKSYDGLLFCTYFLHSPSDGGMYLLESNMPPNYFEKLGSVTVNEYNHFIRSVNMPEGCIYAVPSYLKSGTTSNMSDDIVVQINFTLDVVDR